MESIITSMSSSSAGGLRAVGPQTQKIKACSGGGSTTEMSKVEKLGRFCF